MWPIFTQKFRFRTSQISLLLTKSTSQIFVAVETIGGTILVGVLRFLSTRRSYFRQRIAVHQHFASFREVKILTLRKIATRLRKSRSQKGSPGQISHAFSNPTSQRRFSWQIATSPRSPCAQLTLKMTSRSRFLKNPTFRYIAPYNTTKTQNF